MYVHVMVSCQPYIDPKPEKEVSETAGMSPICRERCLPAEKSTLWLVFLFCTSVFLLCTFVFYVLYIFFLFCTFVVLFCIFVFLFCTFVSSDLPLFSVRSLVQICFFFRLVTLFNAWRQGFWVFARSSVKLSKQKKNCFFVNMFVLCIRFVVCCLSCLSFGFVFHVLCME